MLNGLGTQTVEISDLSSPTPTGEPYIGWRGELLEKSVNKRKNEFSSFSIK